MAIVYRPSKPKRKPKPTAQPVAISARIVKHPSKWDRPAKSVPLDPGATESVQQFFLRMGLVWTPKQHGRFRGADAVEFERAFRRCQRSSAAEAVVKMLACVEFPAATAAAFHPFAERLNGEVKCRTDVAGFPNE
jgi:hypothetical protein